MGEILIARVRELETFCSSPELSPPCPRLRLEELVEGLTWNDLRNSSFLHRLCLNLGVSLGLVEFLLQKYPEAARINEIKGIEGMCPIHCACENECCPDTVIQLLATKNPSAMKQHCYVSSCYLKRHHPIDYVWGLPLHRILLRHTNLTLDTVKLLVNADPGALVTPTDDVYKLLPIHVVFYNKGDFSLNDIVQYLIETEPSSSQISDVFGSLPLHQACADGRLTFDTFQLMIDVFPDALMLPGDILGSLPIHILCKKFLRTVSDEMGALRTLALFVESSPASVQEMCIHGCLPIYHLADKHPEYFKLLLDQYPESAGIEMGGEPLIHRACRLGHINTVDYLLQSYPESINIRDSQGFLPIHIIGAFDGDEQEYKEKLKLLLSRDPSCASKRITECNSLPLHLACSSEWSHNFAAEIFDAHPEALCQHDRNGQSPLDLARRERKLELINFLEANLIHSRLAEDAEAMAARDLNGRLPLHSALCNNATLGAVKLLVRGNPAALEDPDNFGSFPLHLACEFCSANVVQFLLRIEDGPLDRCNENMDFPLHSACRGGNLDAVSYLLGSRNPSVTRKNGELPQKLPIHLLFESEQVDRDSLEYVNTIWQLLLAHPMTILEMSPSPPASIE